MKEIELQFTEPSRVTIRDIVPQQPDESQVRVTTSLSAISAGTEMLVFNGAFQDDMAVDTTISCFHGKKFQYPLCYGYCSVGVITAVGSKLDASLSGKRVFAFHPHASHFTANIEDLVFLPDDIADDDCVFLASMETAVNLILDGAPLLDEKAVIFGQGIVGLLVTAVLSKFPLNDLLCIDPLQKRRDWALSLGATRALAPSDALSGVQADLLFELSGAPNALNQAIQCCGFDSRIVLGSWYGTNNARLDLGGNFHRNRISILSSQVSSVASKLRGRWNKKRRIQTALRMLAAVKPSHLISHRFSIYDAQSAYLLLTQEKEKALQVVFYYPA